MHRYRCSKNGLPLVQGQSLHRAYTGTAMLLLAALSLTGCSHLPAREPVTRNIPGPPDYLNPLPKPPSPKGSNAFVISAQRGAVIDRQNTIIVSARSAWTKMKDTYSKSFLKRKIFGGS